MKRTATRSLEPLFCFRGFCGPLPESLSRSGRSSCSVYVWAFSARSRFWLGTFFLALLLLASAVGADDRPVKNVSVATRACEDPEEGGVELELELQTMSDPSSLVDPKGGQGRALVLRGRAVETGEELQEIWRFEDKTELAQSDTRLMGEFLCAPRGAGGGLYGIIYIWKSSADEAWEEAWFFMIRLPFGRAGDRRNVIWQEHIPRIPLRDRGPTEHVDLFYRDHEVLIVAAPPEGPNAKFPLAILASLSNQALYLYAGDAALPLGDAVAAARSREANQPSPDEQESWFSCSSLMDCSAIEDSCGKPVGVRQDSEEAFRLWDNDRRAFCYPHLTGPMTCNDYGLACREGACTILWFDEVSGEPCVHPRLDRSPERGSSSLDRR